MKIALFLDVDITLTEDYIQKVYATELGVEPDYRKIEEGFQAGQISSAAFGSQLSDLFARQKFSKKLADELFDKIKLKPYVDELFALQKIGVAIYLVSSGPNYYIDTLARRYEIPTERTRSSTYYFENGGIISRCNAIDANAKMKFVLLEKDNYDVTIGIGDDDRHDTFVSVCTIAMLTKPKKGVAEDFIHVAHFHSVLLLVKNLLGTKTDLNAAGAVVHSTKVVSLKNVGLIAGGAVVAEVVRALVIPNTDWILEIAPSEGALHIAVATLVAMVIAAIAWALQKYLRLEPSSELPRTMLKMEERRCSP